MKRGIWTPFYVHVSAFAQNKGDTWALDNVTRLPGREHAAMRLQDLSSHCLWHSRQSAAGTRATVGSNQLLRLAVGSSSTFDEIAKKLEVPFTYCWQARNWNSHNQNRLVTETIKTFTRR